VYITKPTADPAAKTVFDQRTFSTVNGETEGGRGLRGTDKFDKSEEIGLFNVNVPTNAWMSLIGASAKPNENQFANELEVEDKHTVDFSIESNKIAFIQFLTFRDSNT
jgi:hypothetical protein